MTTTSDQAFKYKPDDRVIAKFDGPGTIIKVSKLSAEVRADRDGKTVRINLLNLRPETVQDVEARARKASLLAWRAREPEHTLTIVQRDHYRGGQETGAVTANARTPAELRKAAEELLKLAAWFEEMPEPL